MVPLNTPLKNGQTVEVTAVKSGGPSLDWLNAELGYVQSARSKAKVRAWFNAQAQAATIARGREAVEKLLQREGRTALKHAELATRLGFRSADALFEVVGKDELSLKSIEALLRPAAPVKNDPDAIAFRPSRSKARRGRRARRRRRLAAHEPREVLPAGAARLRSSATSRAARASPCTAPAAATCASWSRGPASASSRSSGGAVDGSRQAPLYPVDLSIEASDRSGLLRDVSEVLAKEKINVTGVRSQSVRDGGNDTAFMTFTIEVAEADAARVGAGAGARRRRRALGAPSLTATRATAHGQRTGNRRRPIDRHGGDAVLRRAVDEPVGVGEVDERVALAIDHADDAQPLEDERDALAEHLLVRVERLGAERDRADLAAGDRRFGLVLGEAERAADAAGLGARDVAGDAGDLRVVVGVDDDLVVRADELERGVDVADRLGAGAAGDDRTGRRRQSGFCRSWRACPRVGRPTGCDGEPTRNRGPPSTLL